MKKLIFPFLAIILLSCNENPTRTDGNVQDFLPLIVGNYWIYSGYETNSAAQKIQGSEFIDSIVVVENISATPRNKVKVLHYRNGSFRDTIHLEKNRLELAIKYDEEQTFAPELGEFFAKIIDYNSPQWLILGENFEFYEIESPKGDIADLRANFIINVREAISDTMLILDELRITDQYEEQQDSYLRDKIDDGDSLERFQKFNKVYNLVENIGIVRYEALPFSTNWFYNRNTDRQEVYSEEHNGIVLVLLRHDVKVTE